MLQEHLTVFILIRQKKQIKYLFSTNLNKHNFYSVRYMLQDATTFDSPYFNSTKEQTEMSFYNQLKHTQLFYW